MDTLMRPIARRIEVDMISRAVAYSRWSSPESEEDLYQFASPRAVMFGPCFLSVVPSSGPDVQAIQCQSHDEQLLPLMVTPIEHETLDYGIKSVAIWVQSNYPEALAWETIAGHVTRHSPVHSQLVKATRTMWALGAYGSDNPWAELGMRQRLDPANARHCATRAHEPMMRVMREGDTISLALDVHV